MKMIEKQISSLTYLDLPCNLINVLSVDQENHKSFQKVASRLLENTELKASLRTPSDFLTSEFNKKIKIINGKFAFDQGENQDLSYEFEPPLTVEAFEDALDESFSLLWKDGHINVDISIIRISSLASLLLGRRLTVSETKWVETPSGLAYVQDLWALEFIKRVLWFDEEYLTCVSFLALQKSPDCSVDSEELKIKIKHDKAKLENLAKRIVKVMSDKLRLSLVKPSLSFSPSDDLILHGLELEVCKTNQDYEKVAFIVNRTPVIKWVSHEGFNDFYNSIDPACSPQMCKELVLLREKVSYTPLGLEGIVKKFEKSLIENKIDHTISFTKGVGRIYLTSLALSHQGEIDIKEVEKKSFSYILSYIEAQLDSNSWRGETSETMWEIEKIDDLLFDSRAEINALYAHLESFVSVRPRGSLLTSTDAFINEQQRTSKKIFCKRLCGGQLISSSDLLFSLRDSNLSNQKGITSIRSGLVTMGTTFNADLLKFKKERDLIFNSDQETSLKKLREPWWKNRKKSFFKNVKFSLRDIDLLVSPDQKMEDLWQTTDGHCSKDDSIIKSIEIWIAKSKFLNHQFNDDYTVPVTIPSITAKAIRNLEDKLNIQEYSHPEASSKKYDNFRILDLDPDLHEHHILCQRSLRGGKNETFFRGTLKEKGEDLDLAGAYSTIMAGLGLPNWKEVVPLKNITDLHAILNKIDDWCGGGMADIEFNWNQEEIFPCLASTVDEDNLCYPLSGRTCATLVEIQTAVKHGATISRIYRGFYVPWIKNNDGTTLRPFKDIIEKVVSGRLEHKKSSALNTIYKLIGNSLYGVLSSGHKSKTSFNVSGGEFLSRHSTGGISRLFCASHITAVCRAVVSQTIFHVNRNFPDIKILSSTTDGVLLSKKDGALEFLNTPWSPLLNNYQNWRIDATLGNSDIIFERKGEADEIISVTTRINMGSGHDSTIGAAIGLQRQVSDWDCSHKKLYKQNWFKFIQGCMQDSSKDHYVPFIVKASLQEKILKNRNVVPQFSLRSFSTLFDPRRSLQAPPNTNFEDTIVFSSPPKTIKCVQKRLMYRSFLKPVFSKKMLLLGSKWTYDLLMYVQLNALIKLHRPELQHIFWSITTSILGPDVDDKIFKYNSVWSHSIPYTTETEQKLLFVNEQIKDFAQASDNPLLNDLLSFAKQQFTHENLFYNNIVNKLRS